MPDVAHFTAFAIAAITIALIPGPGCPAHMHVQVAGVTSGCAHWDGHRQFLVHVAAAAAGLSALIATSAAAFTVEVPRRRPPGIARSSALTSARRTL